MSTELSRLSELAKAGKTTRFLSLAHLLTPAALMAAFEGLRKDASAGVDDVTYREYEQDVWRNIPTLHHRLGSHQYRVQPSRRLEVLDRHRLRVCVLVVQESWQPRELRAG